MNRRDLILMTGAALTMPSLALSSNQSYTPGLVDRLLADGQTVFIDFYTDWCTTCAAQERVIEALQGENPHYLQNITFVKVDWDQYARDDLSVRLRIPRRSTLVVLKGDQELGRIVAGTSPGTIKTLMDVALDAALA